MTMIKRVLARPAVIDVLLAAVAATWGIVIVVTSSDNAALVGSSLGWPLSAVVAGSSVLLARRTRPVLVAAIVVAARILFVAAGSDDVGPMDIAALVALYSAARGTTRGVRLGVILMLVTATAAAGASLNATDPFPHEFVGEVAFLALPVAVGCGLRQRQERIAQLIDNEAAARVQAERLRIAHDLHDVVAHRLSTIAVQSGVASHLLERDPTMIKDALDTINATGKEALEELRGMVGVLRSTDEPTAAPLQPAPTDPDDISSLVERARRSGLRVTVTQRGSFPSPVTDGVVIAAHRIIGEALANAARHAGAVSVAVTVNHSTSGVVIEVINDQPSGDVLAVPSTGVGIAGMTERAVAVGGSLAARPTPTAALSFGPISPTPGKTNDQSRSRGRSRTRPSGLPRSDQRRARSRGGGRSRPRRRGGRRGLRHPTRRHSHGHPHARHRRHRRHGADHGR